MRISPQLKAIGSILAIVAIAACSKGKNKSPQNGEKPQTEFSLIELGLTPTPPIGDKISVFKSTRDCSAKLLDTGSYEINCDQRPWSLPEVEDNYDTTSGMKSFISHFAEQRATFDVLCQKDTYINLSISYQGIEFEPNFHEKSFAFSINREDFDPEHLEISHGNTRRSLDDIKNLNNCQVTYLGDVTVPKSIRDISELEGKGFSSEDLIKLDFEYWNQIFENDMYIWDQLEAKSLLITQGQFFEKHEGFDIFTELQEEFRVFPRQELSDDSFRYSTRCLGEPDEMVEFSGAYNFSEYSRCSMHLDFKASQDFQSNRYFLAITYFGVSDQILNREFNSINYLPRTVSLDHEILQNVSRIDLTLIAKDEGIASYSKALYLSAAPKFDANSYLISRIEADNDNIDHQFFKNLTDYASFATETYFHLGLNYQLRFLEVVDIPKSLTNWTACLRESRDGPDIYCSPYETFINRFADDRKNVYLSGSWLPEKYLDKNMFLSFKGRNFDLSTYRFVDQPSSFTREVHIYGDNPKGIVQHQFQTDKSGQFQQLLIRRKVPFEFFNVGIKARFECLGQSNGQNYQSNFQTSFTKPTLVVTEEDIVASFSGNLPCSAGIEVQSISLVDWELNRSFFTLTP
ncbi:hypothetical protein [Pseudobacteriovorax antillogorgiicola]|uniref:Lipoprotein n=1 Tax=Pseudobacteriovorax antillogorgiicola TaxID=1513793 RepID=A0A1Y6CRG9_9BACT|nr:hypothetical protein [Pseudobacteriovorax antillogorgiicola]TCS45839.1 hypothetical protein EDD56_1262 [Pseudobacteriovorax antillogorgiicola]SMF71871.1 hypothetical protein SAMN06296036_12696 [Pseudobacteriovorax antillogorgiicola]